MLYNDLIDYNYNLRRFKHQCNIKHTFFLNIGRFITNFRFDTICNAAQVPQELHRYGCACGFIGKCKCYRAIAFSTS